MRAWWMGSWACRRPGASCATARRPDAPGRGSRHIRSLAALRPVGLHLGGDPVGGRVEAFALGERLNPSTAVIHIEKATPTWGGFTRPSTRDSRPRPWRDGVHQPRAGPGAGGAAQGQGILPAPPPGGEVHHNAALIRPRQRGRGKEVEAMQAYQERLAVLLAESGALFFQEGLRLKDGRPTPYFVNLGVFRTGRSAWELGRCFADWMETSGWPPRWTCWWDPPTRAAPSPRPRPSPFMSAPAGNRLRLRPQGAKTHGEATATACSS